MDSRTAARREAALAFRVAQRRSLMDPLFNLREIVKQMVLLEDHLFHPYKLCSDCVHKHLLTIEALAEEATCLAGPQAGDSFRSMTEGLAERARQWLEQLADGTEVTVIGHEVRNARKDLIPHTYDPRDLGGAAARIASLYGRRRLVCCHRMSV
jgi:hypothetical protein